MARNNVVTTRMRVAMIEDRRAGMTLAAIAEKYGVGPQTVSRHVSEAAAKGIRRNEQRKYQRIKNDPTQYAARLAYNRAYLAARKSVSGGDAFPEERR
jgi:predicted transcriptional regulator